MRQLFVGLGNPGKKYELTRHNIGYRVIQDWGSNLNLDFKQKSQFSAYVAKGHWQTTEIHLLLPTTYMNQSGQAVKKYMDYMNFKPEDLVVVVDDIAFPFGQLRLKSGGSAGGHNGLKSIEAHLSTKDYARLRMGIGHNGSEVLADYVLENFTSDEKKTLNSFLSDGIKVLELLVKDNITQVMSKVNTLKP